MTQHAGTLTIWELSEEEMNALSVSVEVTTRLLREGKSPFAGPVYQAYLARLESARGKLEEMKTKLRRAAPERS